MKVKYSCLFLLLILGLVFPINSILAQGSQETMLRFAQLDEVEGEVYVKRGGGLREFPAYNGMSLLEGDFISTQLDSGVMLVFEEDRTTLGEHTQVYLTQLKQKDTKETVLSQWSGQTWSKVKSLLNADDTHDVETPTSVMGVRGTLFSVLIDPEFGTESLLVFDGLVENKLIREYRQNQSGQNVSVSEQLDISLETKERIEGDIAYDRLAQHIDTRIIAAVYHDVFERADELFEENDQSTIEETDREMERILLVLQSEMMLESLDELTQAIERTDEERFQQIEGKLQQSLEEIGRKVLEKRLRQIEQYEELRERAISNGLSDEALDSFIEQHGGIKAVERTQQIENVKKDVEERLQTNPPSVVNTGNNNQSNNGSPGNLNDQITPGIPEQPENVDQETSHPVPEINESENDPIPPIEDDGVVEEITPPVVEEPIDEDLPLPPEAEEDPEEDPGLTPAEVSQIEAIYLGFDTIVEMKSLGEFLVNNDQIDLYQFTGLSDYDPSIVDILFDQANMAFEVRGKIEGETEVTVQIIDKNKQVEPVTVTFTVYVESILPDVVVIPEEYRELLIVTYEHRTEGEADDQLHISVKDGLNGYLNGWLINNISLSPINSQNGSSTAIGDSNIHQIGLDVKVSCSQGADMNQIPGTLCIDINSIMSFEGEELSIVPIIDSFEIKSEITNDTDSFILRDFDENGHDIITAFASVDGQLKTWKVTYEENGYVQTEDFRAYLIAEEIGQQHDSIFNSLLECLNSNNSENAIPGELCLANVGGIKEIKAVFGKATNQALLIENDKNVPVEIQYLADNRIVKLSFTEETDLLSRLFEVNTQINTKIIEHPEILMEYYLYSDGDIQVSIDFIEVPVDIELDGSEHDPEQDIGTVEQWIDFEEWYGAYYLDFRLKTVPLEGYRFKYWLIYWGEDDPYPMEIYEDELMMIEFMHSSDDLIVKAIFEKN